MNESNNPHSRSAPVANRHAVGWGAGVFIGVGLGVALFVGTRSPWLSLGAAVIVILFVGLAYTRAGFVSAEQRAERIQRETESSEYFDEDDEDDGTR